jgi:hypothetical protein
MVAMLIIFLFNNFLNTLCLHFVVFKNEMAIAEQQKADERMAHLAEEHKVEISYSLYLKYLIQLIGST